MGGIASVAVLGGGTMGGGIAGHLARESEDTLKIDRNVLLAAIVICALLSCLATALLDVSGIWLVTVYFAVMCTISAIAAYFSPETYKTDFLGVEKPERRERFVRKPAEAPETVGA